MSDQRHFFDLDVSKRIIFVPMKTLRSAVLAAVALLSVSCRTETKPKPRELTLQAVHIADGDTFEGRDGDKTYRVRLHGIDAPERGQDFSNKSRETLGRLCKNGPLKARVVERDRFGRWVCEVYDRNGLSINKTLVKEGMAWHFKRYSSDRELERLEAEARSSRLGIWSLDDPTPPWKYRKDSTRRDDPRRN